MRQALRAYKLLSMKDLEADVRVKIGRVFMLPYEMSMSRFNVSYYTVYILLELDLRFIAYTVYHIDSYCL